MNELSVIPDGAVLIRNGTIQEAGSSRRVENLRPARNAQEIDAAGRIVIPAFVDPDAALVSPLPGGRASERRPGSLRLVPKNRLEANAAAVAADWTRNGILSAGAHTGHAFDLKEIVKVLRIHQSMQSKPLRIRSVFSPRMTRCGERTGDAVLRDLVGQWLPAIGKRRLAALVEFTANEAEGAMDLGQIRAAAIAAASLGYSLRLRGSCPIGTEAADLALAGGAVSVVAPVERVGDRNRALADIGCVHVLPVTQSLNAGQLATPAVRELIDQGCSVALASGFQAIGGPSANPQFLIHAACALYGMTPAEAIVATTYNAACSLRLSHVTGSLEPGKQADLLIMDVPDYRDLPRRAGHNDIEMVVRAGKPIFRRGGLILD